MDGGGTMIGAVCGRRTCCDSAEESGDLGVLIIGAGRRAGVGVGLRSTNSESFGGAGLTARWKVSGRIGGPCREIAGLSGTTGDSTVFAGFGLAVCAVALPRPYHPGCLSMAMGRCWRIRFDPGACFECAAPGIGTPCGGLFSFESVANCFSSRSAIGAVEATSLLSGTGCLRKKSAAPVPITSTAKTTTAFLIDSTF